MENFEIHQKKSNNNLVNEEVVAVGKQKVEQPRKKSKCWGKLEVFKNPLTAPELFE